MYLNEANPGDTIVIQNLNKIDPPRRNGLRDMGLYERGIVYIDQKDDESIHFHKDSITLAIALDEASLIEVRPYVRD